MSEEVKVLSLPLDNPFDVPDDAIVDLSLTKFADDFSENISTAFIYLRNIEYSGKIDFSKFTKDQLYEIVRLYMIRDIRDLNIKQLDMTVLDLLIDLNDDQHKGCLLFDSEDKIAFISKNSDICVEMFQMLQSLPLFIMSLDQTKSLNVDTNDVMHIADMPMTYECMLQLLKYDEAMAMMFLPNELKPFDVPIAYFDKIFKYDNYQLADNVKNNVFSYMYSILVNNVSNANCSAVL